MPLPRRAVVTDIAIAALAPGGVADPAAVRVAQLRRPDQARCSASRSDAVSQLPSTRPRPSAHVGAAGCPQAVSADRLLVAAARRRSRPGSTRPISPSSPSCFAGYSAVVYSRFRDAALLSLPCWPLVGRGLLDRDAGRQPATAIAAGRCSSGPRCCLPGYAVVRSTRRLPGSWSPPRWSSSRSSATRAGQDRMRRMQAEHEAATRRALEPERGPHRQRAARRGDAQRQRDGRAGRRRPAGARRRRRTRPGRPCWRWRPAAGRP